MECVSVELQAQGRGDVWVCLERSILDGVRGDQPQSGALRTALHRAKRRLRSVLSGKLEAGHDAHTLRAMLA